MLTPAYRNSFEKDVKLAKKRGKKLAKLGKVIQCLIEGKKLPIRNKDHNLTGDWRYHRECHIEPDWLLIYRIKRDEKIIVFERTGTHTDLFE